MVNILKMDFNKLDHLYSTLQAPLFLILTVALFAHPVVGDFCPRRVCSATVSGYDKLNAFHPEDIDPSLCTHVVLNEAVLTGNQIIAGNSRDESTNSTNGIYEMVTQLKQEWATLKVILSVNAGKCRSPNFNLMATQRSSRKQFVNNTIHYLRKHNFDGMELLCVYFPRDKVNSKIKESLSDVVADLRKAFNEESTSSDILLLTLAVYGERTLDDSCYDIPKLSQSVDWINVVAYTIEGNRYPATEHHSSLYSNCNDEDGQCSRFSVDTAVNHWISRGAPADKLVLALPSFGWAYTLETIEKSGGAKTTQYTDTYNFLSHSEICMLLANNDTYQYYLKHQQVPYLVTGNRWVDYDDAKSLKKKVSVIKKHRLGGFLFVSLELDDYSGRFCKNGPYPLLKFINEECDKH